MSVTSSVRSAGSSRFLRSPIALWAPVAACMGVIFALSSISSLPSLPGGMSDTVAHAIEYSGLAALTLRALARGTWAGVRRGTLIGAVLIAVLYGVSDELHQWFVPGRSCDVRDLAGDAFGAAGAVGAIGVWGIIRRFSGFDDDRA